MRSFIKSTKQNREKRQKDKVKEAQIISLIESSESESEFEERDDFKVVSEFFHSNDLKSIMQQFYSIKNDLVNKKNVEMFLEEC